VPVAPKEAQRKGGQAPQAGSASTPATVFPRRLLLPSNAPTRDALEDLGPIREQVKARKAQHSHLAGQSFAQLRGFATYKAALKGTRRCCHRSTRHQPDVFGVRSGGYAQPKAKTTLLHPPSNAATGPLLNSGGACTMWASGPARPFKNRATSMGSTRLTSLSLLG
jgi:hypothetical protein